jgi:tetratricopeptide (TPR) repeat protein
MVEELFELFEPEIGIYTYDAVPFGGELCVFGEFQCELVAGPQVGVAVGGESHVYKLLDKGLYIFWDSPKRWRGWGFCMGNLSELLGSGSIDELIEHYLYLPPISERADIVKVVEGYDPKVMGRNESWSNLRVIARNPLPSAFVLTDLSMAGLYFGGVPADSQIMAYALPGVFFGSAVLLGLANDYLLKKRKAVKPVGPKPGGLQERIRLGLMNHPKLVGLGVGFSMAGFVEFLEYFTTRLGMPAYDMTHLFAMMTGIIGYASTYLLAGFAKSNQVVGQGFKEYRRRHYEPDSSGVKMRKMYDGLMEHPGAAAVIGGLGAAAYFVYSVTQNKGLDNIRWEGVPFLGTAGIFVALLASVPIYLGASAVSWAMHSNSLRLMKETAGYGINSLLKKYDAAVNNLRKVMEIPTSQANELSLHTRMGNLMLKNGDAEEALGEYYKAIELAGANDRVYTNPMDLIMSGIYGLNPLKRLHLEGLLDHEYDGLRWIRRLVKSEGEDKMTTLQSRVAYALSKRTVASDHDKDLERLAREIKSRRIDGADMNMRMRIMDEILNPETHLLYAKFLDVMGDRDFANEEYRIAISLVVSNPLLAGNFERIGVSRNEVLTYKADKFLNRTLIFKRSEKREEIEQEYANLSYFYGKLKDKVAKPLAMIEEGRWHYLIMEHAGEKTLHDLAEEGRLTYDTLSEAVGLLCEVQRVGEEYGTGA